MKANWMPIGGRKGLLGRALILKENEGDWGDGGENGDKSERVIMNLLVHFDPFRSHGCSAL